MPEPAPEIHWLTVASFVDVLAARIASGRFESEGIPVLLRNEHFVTANWTLSNAVGGVQVPAECFAQARQLLLDMEAGEFDLDDETEGERCPNCGGQSWSRQTRGRHVALVAFALLGVPLPFLGDQMVCGQCRAVQKSADPISNV